MIAAEASEPNQAADDTDDAHELAPSTVSSSSSSSSPLANEEHVEIEEGPLWLQLFKQSAALELLTDESEKVKARARFLSLIQTIEKNEQEMNEKLEEHIKRGGSKREFLF